MVDRCFDPNSRDGGSVADGFGAAIHFLVRGGAALRADAVSHGSPVPVSGGVSCQFSSHPGFAVVPTPERRIFSSSLSESCPGSRARSSSPTVVQIGGNSPGTSVACLASAVHATCRVTTSGLPSIHEKRAHRTSFTFTSPVSIPASISRSLLSSAPSPAPGHCSRSGWLLEAGGPCDWKRMILKAIRFIC